MGAKTKSKVKIFYFLSVFSVGSMYFNILKTGNNQKYKSSIELFDLHVSKWPSISEKMTPIVLSKSNVNPVPEAYYFIQFQKNTM